MTQETIKKLDEIQKFYEDNEFCDSSLNMIFARLLSGEYTSYYVLFRDSVYYEAQKNPEILDLIKEVMGEILDPNESYITVTGFLEWLHNISSNLQITTMLVTVSIRRSLGKNPILEGYFNDVKKKNPTFYHTLDAIHAIEPEPNVATVLSCLVKNELDSDAVRNRTALYKQAKEKYPFNLSQIMKIFEDDNSFVTPYGAEQWFLYPSLTYVSSTLMAESMEQIINNNPELKNYYLTH